MSTLTYTVSSPDGIATGTFRRPEVLPQPGDRLVVTKAFSTPGNDIYLEGDILILIRRTDEAPHGRLSSLGNWLVASKTGVTVWANIEYALAETQVLAPLDTKKILLAEADSLLTYDVDLILRAIDRDGVQYLVLWIDDTTGYSEWLFIPMTDEQYAQLMKVNHLECLSLRDFIKGSPLMYLAHSLWADFDFTPGEFDVVPITKLDEKYMPLEGGYILLETYKSWAEATGRT